MLMCLYTIFKVFILHVFRELDITLSVFKCGVIFFSNLYLIYIRACVSFISYIRSFLPILIKLNRLSNRNKLKLPYPFCKSGFSIYIFIFDFIVFRVICIGFHLKKSSFFGLQKV